jgi:para-nitrobenzyl esterase
LINLLPKNVASNNQKLLCCFCLFFATLSSPLLVAKETSTAPIQTSSGLLKSPKQYPNGIGYLGIPYAEAPIKERRWKQPVAVNSPEQIKVSNQYASACYQDSYNIDWYKGVAKEFNHNLTMDMPEVSEDCLYLNVWLPSKNSPESPKSSNSKKRPVMVWIHGGSNKSGWSFEPNYIGNNLAAQGDVIVVSIAYRLGVFGFFSHPELLSQKDKANFAILDQIEALKWIKTNITAFGGDKDNITIMGESAGAANVAYLMATKKAKGLFHKAISQSGGFQWLADDSLENAVNLGEKVSKQLNVNLAELRLKPSDEIWQSIKEVAPKHEYDAVIDNNLYSVSTNLAFKENADVDLLIGSNQHEFYMYQADNITTATLAITPENKNSEQQLLAKFDSYKDKKAGQDWLDTFLYMSCPSMIMAEIVNQKPNRKSYVYRFDRIRVGGEKLKAYHGAEIPYMFDKHDTWLPVNKEDQALTAYMIKAWSNFAKHGNPNGAKLSLQPAWPSYNVATNEIIKLNGKVASSTGIDMNLCNSIWPSDFK